MTPLDNQAPEQSNAIADAVRLLVNQWPVIVPVFLALSIYGTYRAFVEPPVYRSEAMIQVELRGGRAFDANTAFLGLSDAGSSGAEIELIQSRSVAESAVTGLDSDLIFGPRYWGEWGVALSRINRNLTKPASPWMGMADYAWGGEGFKVDSLQVPEKMRGTLFTVIAGGDGQYELRLDEKTLAHGKVSEVLQLTLGAGPMSLLVSDLRARPGTKFWVMRERIENAANNLRSRLQVQEKGRGTGILLVRVQGPSPDRIAEEANALAEAYLQGNVERRSEEAQKRLDFLNSQLPRLKVEVEAADSKLREFKSQRATATLSRGGEAKLSALTEIESKLASSELDLADMRRNLTDQHPSIQAMQRRIAQLRDEKLASEKELSQLPAVELDLIKLSRDSKIANDLYVLLLNKAQELKVAKAGTVGNVFVIDRANPNPLPIKPNRWRTLFQYLLMGAVLGVIAAFIRQALHTRILNGDAIEERLGLPVFAVIPSSTLQSKLIVSNGKAPSGKLSALAVQSPKDLATESLRSLCTSLQFALGDANSKIITFAGAAPEVGKTFINLNMAVLMAAAGRRTLLIDGDLRKGRLHQYFGIPRSPGLSEVIAGTADIKQAIQTVADQPNLSFLPSGRLPPNPAELLGSERFLSMVKQLGREYDLVVIDSSPVMNLADALLISRLCGVTFMVVRERKSSWREMELAIARYARDGLKIKGVVINGVRFSKSRYGYHAYPYYHY